MKYIIEVYETYAQKYEIEANSEGEAIHKIYEDEGKAIDKPQFIMTNEDIGMPTQELDQQTIDAISPVTDYIPAIRSITEMNNNPWVTPNPKIIPLPHIS